MHSDDGEAMRPCRVRHSAEHAPQWSAPCRLKRTAQSNKCSLLALQGGAAFDAFDPFAKQPKMSYKDGYQKRYFVLDSFHAGAEQLKAYCASLHLPPNLPDPDCKTL